MSGLLTFEEALKFLRTTASTLYCLVEKRQETWLKERAGADRAVKK
ncbi:MAG: hypothetical protein WCG78_02155 [Candidatus Omnitrophota bacterium]